MREIVPRAVAQLAAAANRQPYAACAIGVTVAGLAAARYFEGLAPGASRWGGFAEFLRGRWQAFASDGRASPATPERASAGAGTHLHAVED